MVAKKKVKAPAESKVVQIQRVTEKPTDKEAGKRSKDEQVKVNAELNVVVEKPNPGPDTSKYTDFATVKKEPNLDRGKMSKADVLKLDGKE